MNAIPITPETPNGNRPHPKQRAFLYLADVLEVFYGGAAAGGKSSALLMAAAQFVDVPGYSALLLRSSFPDLMQPDALIPRSKEWWIGKAKWSPQEKRWTFPSGATITFGYLERDDDVMQYRGAAYQFIGIDELTEHTEFRYRYLFSRIRKPKDGPLSKVPLRMRSASNPGGKGHAFVKQRFIDLRTREPGAVFVPASLADNPTMDAVGYVKSLSKLDPITRAQLLAGDWNAFEGSRFRKEWFYGKAGDRGWWLRHDRNGNVFYCFTGGPKEGIPASLAWTFIICDPAARAEEIHDNTAIGVFAVMPHGEVLVLEMVREHLDIEAIVPRIAQMCAEHNPEFVGIENTGFSISLLREAQRNPGIPAVKPLEPEGKSKLVRATPAIIFCSNGQLFVPVRGPMYPFVEDYVSELTTFTGNEDEDGLVDAVDVTAYAIQTIQRHGLSMPSIITPEQAQHEANSAGSGGIFMSGGGN